MKFNIISIKYKITQKKHIYLLFIDNIYIAFIIILTYLLCFSKGVENIMSLNKNIMPVLIGADMNCYSVARAFHEAYGVKSNAFGRWAMGETMYSKIVDFTPVPDIDNAPTLQSVITQFANKHENATCIVLGCTDDYASLLIDIKHNLPKNCIVPYIAPELRDKLVSKAQFYNMCDEHGIFYPKTKCANSPMEENLLSEDELGFSYPVIIKPSSSIMYWKFPFDNMKKVYVAQNAKQAADILKLVYASGYNDTMIIQDMIPGDDSYMRVLTAYCDKNAQVKMMCMGHVGLEEKTPKAIGNHAAIITEYNGPVMEKIKTFLEDIAYTGYANFDIKYDTRDGTYRVFEINLRQGRSNFYVTGSGFNIAKYIVEDLVMNKDLGGCQICKNAHYWRSVPDGVVFKYVKDSAFVEKAKMLKKQKNHSTTLGYKYDFKNNPKRLLYYIVHMQRYFKKFKTYCK